MERGGSRLFLFLRNSCDRVLRTEGAVKVEGQRLPIEKNVLMFLRERGLFLSLQVMLARLKTIRLIVDSFNRSILEGVRLFIGSPAKPTS